MRAMNLLTARGLGKARARAPRWLTRRLDRGAPRQEVAVVGGLCGPERSGVPIGQVPSVPVGREKGVD